MNRFQKWCLQRRLLRELDEVQDYVDEICWQLVGLNAAMGSLPDEGV